MSQVTIYLDDDTARVLKLHTKSSGESASRWISGAIKKRARAEWPPDILAIFGTWKDSDFPDAGAIRNSGDGTDIPRESF